jgi:hypothetical protein
MVDSDLEKRRLDAETYTVDEAVALGYRLQVVCMACDRRPILDLRTLARRGYGARPLRSLNFRCEVCARAGRKMSIHPPGKDTFLRVLFQGGRKTRSIRNPVLVTSVGSVPTVRTIPNELRFRGWFIALAWLVDGLRKFGRATGGSAGAPMVVG